MAEGRILNVNDDGANRESVSRMLSDAGFEVLEAATGQQALDQANDQPDLIILDVKLPDLDGFEVARRIRANPATRLLPVLHVSTKLAGVDSRALGLESGADGYLSQPVEAAELIAAVRAILRTRRADRELRLSHEQNSVILQNIADAVTAQNSDGKVVYANDAALAILGYAGPQQFLEGNDSALTAAYEMLDEEGRPFDPNQLPARLILGGAPEARALVRWRRRDGGQDRWTIVQSRPVRDEYGRVTLAINILHDVTERRRNEQRMALLSEASAVLTASLEYDATMEGVVRLLVPRLGNWSVLHLIEGDEVRWTAAHTDGALDARLREMAAATVPLANQKVLPPTLFNGQSELTELDDAKLADRIEGEPQRAFVRSLGTRSLMCAPLNVRGQTIGALTVASPEAHRYAADDLKLLEDLAHRAALAVDNARAYRRAEEASQMRRDLIAVVAHDLKNPLNAITMAAALLSKGAAAGTDGDRARRQSAIIARASDRMNRLIHDLLDVTGIEAGRMELDTTPQPVGALVNEAIDSMATLAAEKQVILERALDPSDEAQRIAADHDRLLQVFSNLIGNAIKFSLPGGRITLSATRRGQSMEFAVKDTGTGIAPEHLPHVFDRFWRIRGSRRDGTGLGLWIVKGLVEAHGGVVSVDTDPGAGSTFRFTVPLAL
ncbi:MAG: diguanylate cyclase/phosphodiesterase [Myxococcales bacterium]|nr:diguanylate cyclase/phosphodiesterase [Myxococcales bacterium]